MSNHPIEFEGHEFEASGPGTRPPRIVSYLAMGVSVVPFVFATVLSYKMVFNPEVVKGGVSMSLVWLNAIYWLTTIGLVTVANCTCCLCVKYMFFGPGTRHPKDDKEEDDTEPIGPGR